MRNYFTQKQTKLSSLILIQHYDDLYVLISSSSTRITIVSHIVAEHLIRHYLSWYMVLHEYLVSGIQSAINNLILAQLLLEQAPLLLTKAPILTTALLQTHIRPEYLFTRTHIAMYGRTMEIIRPAKSQLRFSLLKDALITLLQQPENITSFDNALKPKLQTLINCMCCSIIKSYIGICNTDLDTLDYDIIIGDSSTRNFDLTKQEYETVKAYNYVTYYPITAWGPLTQLLGRI